LGVIEDVFLFAFGYVPESAWVLEEGFEDGDEVVDCR